MKIKVTITEISHDDLVDLISTAFTYSSIFVVDYDSIEYEQLPNTDENNDCIEDKMAKLLLAGKSVKFCDTYAEDSSDSHGSKLPHEYDSDYGVMDYTVTLKDIKKGLQKALNKGGYSAECAMNLINADGNLDQPQAEGLVQYIIFGEPIYG